jgi:hypothetical protein
MLQPVLNTTLYSPGMQCPACQPLQAALNGPIVWGKKEEPSCSAPTATAGHTTSLRAQRHRRLDQPASTPNEQHPLCLHSMMLTSDVDMCTNGRYAAAHAAAHAGMGDLAHHAITLRCRWVPVVAGSGLYTQPQTKVYPGTHQKP